MPLELHPMTESDLPAFDHIQHRAFQDGIASLLFPEARTPEQVKEDIERNAKALQEPDARFLKVIDTDLDGKIIACARWRVNTTERTEEEVKAQLRQPGPDASLAFIDFIGFLNKMRQKWMGTKPFYFLHILVTDPDHHRRGAGGMLVRWGLERADKDGLPAYLEASPAGRPLYERLGFKEVELHDFDLTKYGGEGVETSTVMIRPPQ